MKKRVLSLLLVLCLTLALLPVLPVGAYGNDIAYPVTGGNIYFDKKTGTITSCDDTVTAANIPEKIDGVAVTAIGGDAFLSCTKLSSVTIPYGVTKIGSRAFFHCAITSVNLPSTLQLIDDYAFQNCAKLTSIAIPAGVTSVGGSAFSGCDSLTSATIPNTMTEISQYTFFNCTALTSVIIPDGVKTIDNFAFMGCTALPTVYIPASVTRIEQQAFSGCSRLTSVYFEGDAPKIGDGVFFANGKSSPIPGLTLYYIEGKSGWTTPKWNGYPTATWDGKRPFVDVPENAWYAEAVNYAVENGLMNGMGNNEFQPNTSMTRAMLVTVLWRYAKSPKQGENTFTDVPAGKYYTEAVAWAAANGIVNGVGDGKFNPDGNITREQLVTILYRYCKQLNIDTSKTDDLTGFPDAGNVGNSAKDAMRWAVAEKLIGGKTLDASGTVYLQPKGSATRAEVATILMRFIENILK